MQDYIVSLLDPFDITIRQPKIDDGRASVSAGLRLRATGQITIDDTNRMMVLYLFPGIANCINWQEEIGGIQGPALFPDHAAADGLSVTNALRHRVVSCGLRMELMNASLENDGYWEAARVPVTVSDFSLLVGSGGTLVLCLLSCLCRIILRIKQVNSEIFIDINLN